MDDQDKALEKIEAENKKLSEQLAENEIKKKALIDERARTVIADIKEKVEKYGITSEQIYGVVKVNKTEKSKKSKNSENSPVFLYMNEKGEGWTGGRGATPKWVKAVKDSGGDIEKYKIKK